jgi:maleylacetoacetate isomerase
MRPTLYQFWRSSASWRVRWALAIKNISFDVVTVDIAAGEQFSEAHRARNPLGLVPALEMPDGLFLAESVVILEYLDETQPAPPLYPSQVWARARVRQVVELINASIQPMQNLAVYQRHSSEPEEQRSWQYDFNLRGLQALERLLGVITAEGFGGRFAVGNSLTAADLFVVPQVYSARRFGVDLAPFPRVRAVEASAMATEHAAAVVPERQPGAPKPKR